MSVRFAQSWQVMLADLSLILFIATAAALDASEPAGPIATSLMPSAAMAADEIEPVAVFRAGRDADFARWLSDRPADPRERLTIRAHYAAGDRETVSSQAEALAEIAAAAGFEPRLLVEPAGASETVALFAFAGDLRVAR